MAQERTRSLARVAVDRVRQDRGLRPLVLVTMLAFVVVVYAVVVVAGGAILGRTGAPSLWLSVLATAIVAIAFEPVRVKVKRFFAKALHQDRTSPYQVLARFPKTVTGAYPAEELPTRMAKVLTEGTGAARSEVWLVVHGRLELAASWPEAPIPSPIPGAAEGAAGAAADGAAPAAGHRDMAITQCAAAAPALGVERPGASPHIVVEGLRHSLGVRERGELLGALTVVVREGQQLSPVEERLFAGLAAQSGLMLRVAGLRAELERQLAALEQRTEQLRRARRDLVTRQDAERQRLERNIHDGAQQEVIALLVNLRLTQTLLSRAPERGARLLAEQAAAARATIDTLTALSRGLYPRLLTDAGPVAALTAAVASGPIPVDLTSDGVPRCRPDVEAAVYFSCLEAVQNASKHSQANRIWIDIRGRTGDDGSGEILLSVTDDGAGFDPSRRTGNGLLNICDRIECVHGSVSIRSAPGRGTSIHARIPLANSSAVHADETESTAPAGSRVLTGAPVVGG